MGGILLESREGLAESQEFGERERERSRESRDTERQSWTWFHDQRVYETEKWDKE